MKSFNEGFYIDQDMLDFIEANYTVVGDVIGWSNLDLSLCYSDCDKGFYLAYYISEDNKLTKEEFKQKIGMPTEETAMGDETLQEQATFGKKDLVDGMFVKTRDGNLYMKLGNSCYSLKAYLELSGYTEGLMDIGEECDFDIVEVFTKQHECCLGLSHILEQGLGITSIWKRTLPKSERQVVLEANVRRYEDELLKAQQNLAAVKQQLEKELTL